MRQPFGGSPSLADCRGGLNMAQTTRTERPFAALIVLFLRKAQNVAPMGLVYRVKGPLY